MKKIIVLLVLSLSACQAADAQANKVPLISQGLIIGQAVPLRAKTVLLHSPDGRTLKKEVYIPNPRISKLNAGDMTLEQWNKASGFEHGQVYSRHDSLFVTVSFTPKQRGVCDDTLKVWSPNLKRPAIRLYLRGEAMADSSSVVRSVESGSTTSLSGQMELSGSGYKLYPNPAGKMLYIEKPALQKAGAETQMNVTNLTGRILYQGPFQSALVVEDWPKGVYILSIQSAGTVQRMKFLKE